MVEPDLSSSIHTHVIFQAWMWDSNQKNQPGNTEAILHQPHQQKLNFIVIHPLSLGQHNKHIIIGFTMISTRWLVQASMDAIGIIHPHCEEFSCLLVSQSLQQTKPRSLGHKMRPTLQDLPHIPIPGLLCQTERKPPLGFTIYLAIHQQGFLDSPRQHILGFATTHSLV